MDQKENSCLNSAANYVQYRPLILRIARSISGSSQSAEDICQDVFLILARGAGWNEKSSVTTWLYGVTRNAARSYIRKASRDKKRIEAAALRLENHAETCDIDVLEKRQLQLALSKISSKYREPLLMYEVEGISYSEIALALNINEGTVRSRLNMAREKLLVILNEETT